MPARPPFLPRFAIATIAVVVLVASLILPRLLRPPRYIARVTMEVRPDAPTPPAGINEAVLANVKRDLREPALLDLVIDELRLDQELARGKAPLSRAETRQVLLEALHVEGVRNTGLVELGVADREPLRAANIANSLSVAYGNKRAQAAQAALEQTMAPLKTEVAKQHRTEEEASKAISELRAKYGIPEGDPQKRSADSAPLTPASEAHPDYVEARARYLAAAKSLEAAEGRQKGEYMAHASELNPVRIWEKATPPLHPEGFSIFRPSASSTGG